MNDIVSRSNRILVCTLFLITASCQSDVGQQSAITNVTVIDAVHGARSNQTVIYENDRIVAVTSAEEPTTAANQIDGSGKFLIPGLWDMHVHLTFDPRLSNVMPAMFLRYGITSVRDTGGLLENLLPIVAAMRAPQAIAPRVFFSGPLMDGEHVVYDGTSVPEIGIQNTSVEDAAANVAHLKQSGADFVKIYEMVSPEVFAAIAAAAHDNEMPVAAHVPLSMMASDVAASVNSLEHLRNIELDCAANADELLDVRLDALRNEENLSGSTLRSTLHDLQRTAAVEALDMERCKEVMVALRNVIQVPTAAMNTLSIWPHWERDDWAQAISILPKDVQLEWQEPPIWYIPNDNGPFRRFADHTLSMIAMMKSASVPIGAGTDTPIARGIPGDSLHSELAVLVAGGLTPLEAIESATVRPAEFFGIESKMGAIQEGMVADLVLLNADPLLNISNTRAIEAVIFRGRLLEDGDD
jgi:imidazolonepropionase-like amidohydrolase